MRVRVRTVATVAVIAAAVAACRRPDTAPVAVGTLERDRIELVAEAPEPIVTILVREGDRVAAGQELLRLDDARFRAQVAQAEAALERIKARLAELVRGPREEQIAEARARLAGTEGSLATQRREVERARVLARSGTDTPQRLDLARARYDEALARRDGARAALDALESGTTAEELAQARAAVAEAAAALAAVHVPTERLVVHAPQDGQIDALPYEVGERPPAGAVVVVMLAHAAPYARVYVPEPIRVRLTAGRAATVRVDGLDGELHGRVRSVSHEAVFTPYFALTERDRGHLSYVAEVELTDPSARHLPTGVPVQVTFDLTTPAAATDDTPDD